ncbi:MULTISPECIES: MerR family transcriptional regulator [Marinobacter]|jgi:DNA-binding transcriptional MerR regulator|uniref:MerR family transcriptional regulator n=2 Tax=Marinobacter TaxID=2742 RepID=A0A5M3Q3H3_9GAMM|nr:MULTISPECIES: MerR family DNA-binding transcriptional regulator [Marinobacter]MBO6811855.1 MerR family DNA-binding transcriptional regulator [Marinobacter sp.]MBO6875592.1 MerR family DNA-binding transcriptional regulator [Marinobacter sp.]MBY6072976.1 MerR family DNA-binding transcriptional regulator [Marinobacter salsuginis]ODM31175.1 MerR family transcriptional regulator [Marinobacter adhaerens]QTN41405.1 MerR family DNA-binding transcriptional regulator [Marinobacter salsuginis]|tara:strand:- start:159 stop:602 length:444 start_codon:yes stop_codon:yes gene_type:complete
MVEKRTFSISELSQEFDVTTRSIRFYEDQGLLKPRRRGQTRIFSTKDRVRLKLILRGKRMGFTLAETRELFDLWDETLTGNEKQLLKMLEILDGRKAMLEQQKNDIAQAEMEIDTAEARCREALAELQKKKKQQAPANDEARQTAEN